jgi:hypothetical protein
VNVIGHQIARFEEGRPTTCAVEETIARSDGIVDLVCTGVVVNFPQTKSHKGHVMATVQLDSWGTHGGECLAAEREFCG